MRSIYVPLPAGVDEQLRELARRELRDPKEQAAWLILDGLRRAGFPAPRGIPAKRPGSGPAIR